MARDLAQTSNSSKGRSAAPELNPEMERLELHAFGLRPMLDTAREELGEEAVREILSSLGVPRERLSAPDSWMSLRFVEGFMDQMVRRSGDPAIIDRFSKASISAKYLGLLYPLIRMLGSPLVAYDQVVRVSPRVNKVAFYRMRERRPDFVALEYWPADGAQRETGAWFCRSREVQLSCIPTLFGLARARMSHPRCIARGDECCVYECTWRPSPRSLRKWFGAAIGIAVALGLTQAFSVGVPLLACLLICCGLAGWSSGRSLELRRVVDQRVTEIGDQQEAIERSLRQNEQRFGELLRAKAEVDAKVEVKTRDLRETSDRLSETLHQVQALDRAKTDFFNNVSHELRTPLTLILAPIEDLVAGREPPGGSRSALQTVERNASRLLKLINQLLDLAKVDAGKTKLARVPVDLSELLNEIVQAFAMAAARKHVTLALELPQVAQRLTIDSRWIESALTNLIANAMRFVPEAGHITVRALDHGSAVVFEVQDDGPGMQAADAVRVFERFAQAEEGQGARGGTGLGLAIVREAARLHGGEASVTSVPNQGSTFRVTIPRSFDPSDLRSLRPAPRSTAIAHPAEHEAVTAAEPLLPVFTGVDGPLVLVVDDNDDLRAFVGDVLGVTYRVLSAKNGVEALALAAEYRPDLIVSDLTMPEMNGYELCRRVRADPTLRDTPVIVLTAHGDPSAVSEGFQAGADDYMLKPFHARELLARANVHSRLRRLIRETAAQEGRAMLGTLAASVAHQVRNPLTAILSGLPLVKGDLSDKSPPRVGKLIDVMIDSASRIERLTTDLLEVSQVDRADEAEFAPGATLLACARLLAPAMQATEVHLRTNVDVAPHVRGRPADVGQACLNLLDNALRAVPRCGEIEILGRADDADYVIQVGDSGPGVAQPQRARIFEPFGTEGLSHQGTGLGLAIARQIAEQHGGKIALLESKLGGALFELRLPLLASAP